MRPFFICWSDLNENISEPSLRSLCSPLQQSTDRISAPCRLSDRQTAREANALISGCHMIGLAWVLSNKALMSTFNCLHGFPCQVTHTHMHTQTHARTHCFEAYLSHWKQHPSDTKFVFIGRVQTDYNGCHSRTLGRNVTPFTSIHTLKQCTSLKSIEGLINLWCWFIPTATGRHPCFHLRITVDHLLWLLVCSYVSHRTEVLLMKSRTESHMFTRYEKNFTTIN